MTAPKDDDVAFVTRALAALDVLEAIAADRRLLAELDEPTRRRIAIAASHVVSPDGKQKRALVKAFRKKENDARKQSVEAVLETTGIRAMRAKPVFPTPSPYAALPAPEDAPRVLDEARKCYVCKCAFHEVHHFYDQLCIACGDFNFGKRNLTADLRGRTALVTGARVKIGYHAAIKLLRAGARVIVTTRFPRDAAERFAREPDFGDFATRLVVHGLDLRHTPSIELFAKHVLETEPRLDFIIHNACQTVRRPAGFYTHLVEHERTERDALLPGVREVLERHHALRDHAIVRDGGSAHVIADAPALSQLALLDEDHLRGGAIFPEGALDADLQQVDLRERNSWRMKLAEVPTIELLEVQLVNAIAPFVLNARLKPLMARVPTADKHIVNVSAVEGQFYREHKTDKHPHTNMAKAALNMMTRTSAMDYVADGIHMNSVDTGWVTDEDPVHLAEKKVAIHGFHPPLDIVDGAARIVDPIFHGFLTGEHVFGLFLKDYKPTPW